MNRNLLKIGLLLFLLAAVIAAYFVFDLQQYATLGFLKQQKAAALSYYAQHTLFVLIVYALVYILVTALSLPLATVITLLGGALFGFWTALVIVSFASTIGATLAFLSARFIAHDFVQQRYGTQLVKLNKEFEREGAFYLFALRLVPVFPFFIINLVMGLLPIRTWTYYWVSQLGMLPGTAVYVYAGTQLAQINQLSDIASPQLLTAFVLLGLFPLIARKLVTYLRREKVHQ